MTTELAPLRRPKKHQRCINIPHDTDEALVVLAAERGVSVSALVSEVIERAIPRLRAASTRSSVAA